jgi:tetratricopeptide (TPR) repeat protein
MVQPVDNTGLSGDDVLFQIRNRFGNPDHSMVPLNSSPHNEQGIREMMVGGGWKALLKLCGQLEASAVLPHLKVRYATIKIVCMLKLIVRNHALLQHALNALADLGAWDASHNLYQSYPDQYSGIKGSMLPFTVRVLECEANHILSKDLTFFFTLHAECIARAKALGGTSPSPLRVEAERIFHGPNGKALPEEVDQLFLEYDDSKPEVWFQRADEVAFSILTRQVQLREPLLGLQTIGQLLSHYLRNETVIGIICRLYLLTGDVKAARRTLTRLEQVNGDESSHICCIHRGFILVAESQYKEALAEFQKVLVNDPYNMSAVNNAAVCYTFLEDAQRAVALLEDALFSKPSTNWNETSIFNLCTLYELLSDKAIDRRRKVLQLVLDHAPDNFNLLCLRLPAGALAPTNHPPIQP